MFKKDFVLQYLAEKERDGAYVYEIYKAWVEEAVKREKRPGSYGDMRNTVSKLKREGIIETFREEEIPGRWSRMYYRLA
jgi:DNA-binding PadR family transcriptional regulator